MVRRLKVFLSEIVISALTAVPWTEKRSLMVDRLSNLIEEEGGNGKNDGGMCRP